MSKTLFYAAVLCVIIAGCKRGGDSLTCPATKDYLKGGIGNRKFALPNAFTPNGNGENDFIYLLTTDSTLIRSMEVRITDAGGNLLSTLTKSKSTWYGVDANNKAYPTGKYGVDYNLVLNDTAGGATTVQGHTCITVLSAYDTFRVGLQLVKCVKAPENPNNYFLYDMFDPTTLETPYTTGETFCQ